MAIVRQSKDDVRPQAASVFGGERFLGQIILALDQTGGVQQAFENEFTPSPAGLGLAFKGGGKSVGFLSDGGVELAKLLDLRLEGGPIVTFRLVDCIHSLAKIGELLAQRMQQGLNLGFVMIGKFRGFLFEQFGSDGLEFGLEGGLELFNVSEVAGGEGFAFFDAGFGGLQTFDPGGSFSGKFTGGGGKLPRQLIATVFEFTLGNCKTIIFSIPGVKSLAQGRRLLTQNQPSEEAREKRRKQDG